ncbi:MAG: hypothetical protein ACOCTI_05465 [Phycisphaeraceae bacterium]
MRHLLLACCLALASLGAAGCELPAFLSAMGGENLPAAYEFEPEPTLVVVDDPTGALPDPGATDLVAARVSQLLDSRKQYAGSIIPANKLVRLKDELGDAYQRTPLDELSRRLGAKQIIHVQIRDASQGPAPGVDRPKAVVEVKMIDIEQGRRLFPQSDVSLRADAPPPGRVVTVEMPAQRTGIESHARAASLARELALTIGRDVAQLFYRHRKPDPGSRLRG